MAQEGATSDEWTVRRILAWTTDYLRKHGSEAPRLEAEILLAHARQSPRIQLYTQFDELLTEAQRTTMRELVKRRATAEPVAYLVGHKEFFSLDFKVTRDVLIPRPDTETLVMAALDRMKENRQPDILDLCTGSGCVAIALAKQLPRSRVVAVELLAGAAAVARENIEKHQLAERISLYTGDLFAPLPEQRFDLIVSNPPYITTTELATLDPDVRLHEPQTALDGGEDGLDVIRRIIQAAPRWLKQPGWLQLEIDPAQASAVRQLLEAAGFEDCRTYPDLSGEVRVVEGTRTAE